MNIKEETFINGDALSSMSSETLIHNIKCLKDDIEDLVDVQEGVDSKAIAASIATKQGQLKALAAFLDAKKVK